MLRLFLPDPKGFFGSWISKAIPNKVYEFAGIDPKTGEVTAVEPTAGPSAQAGDKIAGNAAALAEHAGAQNAAGAGGSVQIADNSSNTSVAKQTLAVTKSPDPAKALEAKKRIAMTQVD
jgi:hypothetical protein